MGYMHEGEWHPGWYTADETGKFRREPSRFRDRISADGPSGHPAESDRYHLYVSFACPWANRTLIVRKLMGLEGALDLSVVDPRMGEDGWVFRGRHPDDFDGSTEDRLEGRPRLQDVYRAAEPRYTGRVTVPVLFDRKARMIVNNESREIMRMFSKELRPLATRGFDPCPEDLTEEVDGILDAIYEPVNNGVYRAGFAKSQQAYEEACQGLFAALDRWNEHLKSRRYLCGSRLTEADVALYTTLARFDLVYYSHFKCNIRRITDYEHLFSYLCDLYQTPGFEENTRFDHIKVHYYWSQDNVNPTRIVPLGPSIDLTVPHGRDWLGTV